jgi:hypothetical protein
MARCPERSGNSEGESGMNLGDSGLDSSVLLPISLPEVLVSLLGKFISLAIVIGACHRSSGEAECPHWSYAPSRR